MSWSAHTSDMPSCACRLQQHAQYGYGQVWCPIHGSSQLPAAMRSHKSSQHHRQPSRILKIEDLLSPTDDDRESRSAHGDTTVTEINHEKSGCTTQVNDFRRQDRRGSEPDWEGFIERQAAVVSPPGSTKSEQTSAGAAYLTSRSPSRASEVVIDLSTYGTAEPTRITTTSILECEYKLSFRQQPMAARACGHGDRDRRVIDPPPIVELKITRKDGSPTQDSAAFFALHCSLVDAETGKSPGIDEEDCRLTNPMMGSSAASPFHGKDEHGIAGTFFVFADLSCRFQGRFKLHFTLLRINLSQMESGSKHAMVASVTSDVFTAFTAKDFPGMQASTLLLRALRRQGLTVSIKKGSEARRIRNCKIRSTEDNSESDDTITPGHAKRKSLGSPTELKNKRIRCDSGFVQV